MRYSFSFSIWPAFLVFILVFSNVSMCCTRQANRAIADYSGDIDEIWKVRGNADKRLHDYHWFEDQYQQIETHKANILIQINGGKKFSEMSEVNIINNWIGEYNAKSKQYDRVLWKSEHLPYQIKRITSIEDLKE
jgi:hypothetical protein